MKTKQQKHQLLFTGERFVPEAQGNIVIEHYHRYLFAKQFVVGKTVLDIASGEGFGSDLLARNGAKKVYGVDISRAAVTHAKKKYTSENLEFICGECAHIPLPDKSVDIVTSFETIEHHDQHEESMREFMRVLKDDGILVISSPDKKTYSDERNYSNEYHVKELYLDEFKELICNHFSYANFYQQKIFFGSVVIQEKESRFSENYLYKDDAFLPTKEGVFSALYHVAVASNQTAIEADSSLLEQPINDSEVVMEWSNAMAAKDRQLDTVAKNYEAVKDQAEILRSEINEKAEEINSQKSRINNYESQITALETTLNEQMEEISSQKSQVRSYEIQVGELETKINHQEEKINSREAQIHDYEKQVNALEIKIKNNEKQINHQAKMVKFLQEELRKREGVVSKAIRFLKRKSRPVIIRHFPRTADLYQRYRLRSKEKRKIKSTTRKIVTNADRKSVVILTPPHTLFLARLMLNPLRAHGFSPEISSTFDGGKDYPLHIVLCPQFFEKLPPTENTIIFQLEQSINSRWFTPEYIDMLKKCSSIMEYKIDNIDFLVEQGIDRDKIFYLPLGGNSENLSEGTAMETYKKYDFIFYGDSLSSERRRVFLDALSRKYRVKICNEVFADDIYKLIKKSRCVINIHYYENALLETPRIFEALSLGVPVLSESASDAEHYPELSESVLFFKYGSVDDMLAKAGMLLERVDHYARSTVAAVEKSEQRFKFMFDRALAGAGIIEKSVLLENPVHIEEKTDADNTVALSLPETTQRRLSCLNEKNLPPFSLFDGIRFSPGWMACAYSYKVLARHFLDTDADIVTIFEDDAFLRNNDLSEYHLIKEYLKQRKKPWDLFSGIIADINPATKVIDVEEWQGRTFMTIDKMTSTVFNIYSRSGLRHITKWNEHNGNVETNTIDRHLEATGNIRIVVSLPFIAGHKEDLTSSIWGFQNTQYLDWFKASEEKLHSLLRTYKS